ncbi:MAG: hypothetical protein K1X83_05045 [Oligoflexia bacterium]|nr:hypothetical protein [Oligoflexia bacterium]
MSAVRIFETFADRVRDRLARPGAQLCAVLLIAAWYLLQYTGADPDLFARVAMGRLITVLGHVPLQDPFAYTVKKPIWIDHEWLSGLIFYQLSTHGELALFWSKLAGVAISIFFLQRAVRSYAGDSPALLVWLLICVLESCFVWSNTVRSQLFTYLFIPVTLLALARVLRTQPSTVIWFLPPLMLVWCNAHGGFVSGLALLAIALVDRSSWQNGRARTVLAVLALCVAATAINPYGFGSYWSYILEAISMPRPSISEWAPIMPGSVRSIIPILILGVVAAGMLVSPRQVRSVDLCFVAASALMAFRSERLSALFAMCACVFGAPYFLVVVQALESRFSSLSLKLKRAAAVLLAAGLCGAVLTLSRVVWQSDRFTLDYSSFPVGAMEWLRDAGRGGKLLVDFNNGSFALWRGFPKYQIAVDGRYEELYPNSTLDIVSKALDPTSSERSAAMQSVWPDYILLVNEPGLEARWREILPSFSVCYHDEDFTVLSQFNEKPFFSERTNTPHKSLWEPSF